MLSKDKKYSRFNNVIYEDGQPIIYLKHKFIDLENLTDYQIDYMNRFLNMYNELFTKTQPMAKIIKMFYDLETTGTDVKKHSIHQIYGCIEVDDVVVEEFDFRVKPNPKALIEEEALKVSNVTEEQILSYEEMIVIYRRLLKLLGKYVDRFNPREKIFLVGFNNRKFDDPFLRAWFEQNGDQFFGSWFWSDSLDVMVLASQYLLNRRTSMQSFKLKRVALELGLEVDESKLHDAAYDTYLLREVYRIVTGLEYEI